MLTFSQFILHSDAFHKVLPFPTSENRASAFCTTPLLQQELLNHSIETRPLLHAKVLNLIKNFLSHKCSYGSEIEKKIYANISLENFIKRLIKQRPLTFMTSIDYYKLRDGTIGKGGFETIGTENEVKPLTLNDYLSYDEMQISALLSMAVPTHFINNGWRNNRGNVDTRANYEAKGILIGLVGARFEKEGLMEYPHIIIGPPGKNDQQDEKLRQIWAKFYELERFPSYEEALKDHSGNIFPLGKDRFFNVDVYKKRLRMTIEPFLLAANQRARECGRKAYVHAVGIGLGAWLVSPKQGQWMTDVYADVLAENKLEWIADIDFSWFPKDCVTCGKVPENEYLTSGGNRIKIHFSKRNPASKLEGEHQGKLLVASYAWDGNSFPGNEYWLGSEYLAASGDPAAACSSMIPELQNPYINPYIDAAKVDVFGETKV